LLFFVCFLFLRFVSSFFAVVIVSCLDLFPSQ
jgi:hypothetical protein